jgi:hypothetical protein
MQLLEATQTPVNWAYEVWDDLVRDLADEDNHVRAIAAQLLCNLAKSDPRGRILYDFDALLSMTRDERFVTARHSLQVIWKGGVAGERQRQRVWKVLHCALTNVRPRGTVLSFAKTLPRRYGICTTR